MPRQGPFLIRTIDPKDAPRAIQEAMLREADAFPCPTCKLMATDYRIAMEEADNSGHKDEADLLLDYALAVGQALYQHISSHVSTKGVVNRRLTGDLRVMPNPNHADAEDDHQNYNAHRILPLLGTPPSGATPRTTNTNGR